MDPNGKAIIADSHGQKVGKDNKAYASSLEEDEVDEEELYSDPEMAWLSLLDIIDELKELEEVGALKRFPKKVQQKYFGYNEKMMDLAKALQIPPCFKQAVTISDFTISEGIAVKTENRASSIFLAFATILFEKENTTITMAKQAKVIFLKQVEKDYCEAKKSQNPEDLSKCLWLINKSLREHDRSWNSEDWIYASKAYFAPIHVLQMCPRVPYNPHVQRYCFSPVVDHEPPIRFVIESGEKHNYVFKTKKVKKHICKH